MTQRMCDGTRQSRVKTTTVTRVRCSVSSKKGARSQEHEHDIVDLDAEESVADRVDRLLAHQAEARASSPPENSNMIRQSPRLSVRSDKSAGSDMRSGSQPPKHKPTLNEGPATKGSLRNPTMANIAIGLSCGAGQCGFN